MDSTVEKCMAVDSNALIKVFLSILNRENLINNKTYMAAVEKLEKGDIREYVN